MFYNIGAKRQTSFKAVTIW